MSIFSVTVGEPDPEVPGTGAFFASSSSHLSGFGVGLLVSAFIIVAVIITLIIRKRNKYSYDGKKGFSLGSKGKKITGLFSILLLSSALIVPLISHGNQSSPVFADEGETELTLTAFDAELSLEKSANQTVYGLYPGVVKINSSTTVGYTLSVYASTADLLPTNSGIQTKFSGLTGSSLTSLAKNTWGISLVDQPNGQNNDWYAVPTTKETALVLADKTTATPANDQTKVTLGVAIGSDMEVGTYQTTITYVAVAKVEPDETGCTETTQYMQDWNGANTLTTGRIIYLKDKRDEQCYSISKLKDGKVWMTTNLNLAGGTQLSSNDTDMDASYTLPTSLGFQSGNRLPASATSGYTSDTQAFLYNTGNTTNCYDATNQSVDQMCYSYYSWPAVTLGSGQNISTNDTAPYSICPKGWRLPTQTYRATAGGAGEFYNLAASYGLTFDFDERGVLFSTNGNFFNAAGNGTVANFILSGYYYSTENTNYNLNIMYKKSGFLWSATAHTCSDGDGVNTGTMMEYLYSGGVETGDHYFELYNAPRLLSPVRCIKR